MPDLDPQAAKQLANIEAATGRSLADFTEEVRKSGLEKHGQILKHFKAEHGLGHGNANLLAHLTRQALAGGPPPEQDLLAAQYAGKKAALRPLYDAVVAVIDTLEDVETVVQKTGVSFRRGKQFARVDVPSSKRVVLGLNLDETPDDPRIAGKKGGMTRQVVVLTTDDSVADAVDDTVAAWIRAAWERVG